MLGKSTKRAERRWRSRCVWMRRLKRDWNEHGWKRNPVPPYEREMANPWRWDGTTLCNCFFLDHKEAYRFKDTPNNRSFRRRDFDLYREFNVPVQERRHAEVPERTSHSGRYPRNRREHLVNQSCLRCGVLIGRVPAYARTWDSCKPCKLKARMMNP